MAEPRTGLDRLRVVGILAGIGLMFVAVGPDMLRGDPGLGRRSVLLLLFGFFVLSASALGRRIGPFHRTVSVVLVNVLLLAFLVELGAAVIRTVFPVESAAVEGARAEVFDGHSYYRSKPWAGEFWEEHLEVTRRSGAYRPYLLWRQKPYDGKYITIDAAGLRGAGTRCGEEGARVFFFGGSAAWGWGSPDRETIPALLATAGRGRPLCVTNFGQNAYVSTQGVLTLLGQLRSGNVPDAVVFYDGFNDIHAAWESGQAGAHYRMQWVKTRLEGSGSRRARHPAVELLRRTDTFSLLGRLTAPARDRSTVPAPEVPERDVERLAGEVASTYMANYRVVEALSAAYGFEYDFFWQPSLDVDRKPLTGEERALTGDPRIAGSLPLLRAVYRQVQDLAARYGHLHHLGDVFEGIERSVWIDFAHVTPEGNRIIAQRILEAGAARGETALD